MKQPSPALLPVTLHASSSTLKDVAQATAQRYGLTYVDQAPGLSTDKAYQLWLNIDGVSLLPNDKSHGPITIDFTSGRVDHRRKFGGGKGQPLARAIGLHKEDINSVIDATAGFGADAFVIASLGATVTLIERSPVLALMLEHALKVARLHETTKLIANRMTLINDEASVLLPKIPCPDVVYLDPMYPTRGKSAVVKKNMQALHAIIGEDNLNENLLEVALSMAKKRVVVKRPKGAPVLSGMSPHTHIESPNTRYDLYLINR